MCAWNFTFFALILLYHISSFASSTSSSSLSCFPVKAKVTVKERLEDWLSKVFGEAFPFENKPRVEEGGMSLEEESIKKDDKEYEEGEDVKRRILRLRGKTGFFELDQIEDMKEDWAAPHMMVARWGRQKQFRLQGFAKDGVVDGLARALGQPIQLAGSWLARNPVGAWVGRLKEGRPNGVWWLCLEGGAWLVGQVDHRGAFTGENVAFLYQDLSTALVGEFTDGQMVSAREAKLQGLTCRDGILVPDWGGWRGEVEYSYEPPSPRFPTARPLTPDPLDSRYIKVLPSKVGTEAGEGVFARTALAKATTVCLYSGLTMTREDYLTDYSSKLRRDYGEMEGEGPPLHQQAWQNGHQIERLGLAIDVPANLISTKNYTATLGHKVNHAFAPAANCAYTYLHSPRFGPVVAVTTVRQVKEGEELTVDYNYPDSVELPWYRDALSTVRSSPIKCRRGRCSNLQRGSRFAATKGHLLVDL